MNNVKKNCRSGSGWLPLSVSIELVSSSARVTSVKSTQGVGRTDRQTSGPKDRTPGLPGSDKNNDNEKNNDNINKENNKDIDDNNDDNENMAMMIGTPDRAGKALTLLNQSIKKKEFLGRIYDSAQQPPFPRLIEAFAAFQ